MGKNKSEERIAVLSNSFAAAALALLVQTQAPHVFFFGKVAADAKKASLHSDPTGHFGDDHPGGSGVPDGDDSSAPDKEADEEDVQGRNEQRARRQRVLRTRRNRSLGSSM